MSIDLTYPRHALSAELTIDQLLADAVLDPHQNITFQVFDILRNFIVSARLRPGQRLSEKEIAAALCASKTPVREAMIRLDEVNLVRIVPQSGTYVTKISVRRYRTACFIQLQLELGAVRGAALAPDPHQSIAILDDILAQTANAITQEDHTAFYACEDAFHRQLFVMSGFDDAWMTARRTQFDVNRVRHIRRMQHIVAGPAQLAEHQAIVEAIRAKDGLGAENALRAHIGDLDRQISDLVRDDKMRGFIALEDTI
ncbi:GntR family transcriptional regulator [Loktanella salsilacus]|uniref:GntR family transcriptional regulator n=1 Tax=Loktanella salsilacus TaxID=195913 RepID=UPI0037370022